MYTCEYTLVQEIIYLNIDLCFYVRIYILMCIYIDKYLYESACLYIYIICTAALVCIRGFEYFWMNILLYFYI